MAIDKIGTRAADLENLEIAGTEAARMPVGTTAQRANVKSGDQRFNSDLNLMEYYDGTQWKSIDSPPIVSSISPTTETDANADISIAGSNFQSGATVKFVGNDGTEYASPTVTFTNSTTLVAQTPSSALTVANEPYDIQVTNPSGLSSTLADALDAGASPTWTTASGSLMGGATLFEGEIIESLSVSATDPDGDTVTYAVASGDSLPAGLSLNTSTGAITGDPDAVSGDVTSTFDIEASDGVNTTSRSFSMVTTNDESAAYESNLKLWLRAGWNGTSGGNLSGTTPTAAKFGSSYDVANKVNIINSVVANSETTTSSPVNGTTKIKDAQGGVSGLNTQAKQDDDKAWMCDANDSLWVDIPSDNSVFQGSHDNHTICYWIMWEDRSANTGSDLFSPTFHCWAGTGGNAYMAHDWYTNGTSNVKLKHYANGTYQGEFVTPNISGGSNGNKGVWFHIAVVYSGGNISVYLNGVSQSHSLSNTGNLPAIGASQTCNFNGRGDGKSSGLPGNYSTGASGYKSQADIRYYNAALSAGAVADIYNKSRSSFV